MLGEAQVPLLSGLLSIAFARGADKMLAGMNLHTELLMVPSALRRNYIEEVLSTELVILSCVLALDELSFIDVFSV